MAEINLLFGQKMSKSIGGITIDGFISEGHGRSTTITENPIEDGSVFSDHIQVNPDTLTITGIVSNYDVLTGQGSDTRIIDVYQQLRDLIDKKEPVKIVTGLRVYENMGIDSFDNDRDKSNGGTLEFTMSLHEIKIVKTESIAIPKSILTSGNSTTQKQAQSKVDAGKTNGSTVNALEKPSFLDQIRKELG